MSKFVTLRRLSTVSRVFRVSLKQNVIVLQSAIRFDFTLSHLWVELGDDLRMRKFGRYFRKDLR